MLPCQKQTFSLTCSLAAVWKIANYELDVPLFMALWGDYSKVRSKPGSDFERGVHSE